MSKLQALYLNFNLKRIHIGLPEVRLVGHLMRYGMLSIGLDRHSWEMCLWFSAWFIYANFGLILASRTW